MKYNYHLLQLFAEEISSSVEDTGVTSADAAQTEPSDPGAEFESLIKGKYKEQYDSKVQDTVRKRLRSSHETVEKYRSLAPMLELLGQHYGVAAEDVQALTKAVEADDTFYREQAQAQGMAPEQLRMMRSLERQNDQLRQAARDMQRQRMMEVWKAQAEEARNTYPEFDMNAECQNPRFRQLLLSGVDVDTAYLVLHRDAVVQSARQMVANSVAAGAARPSENGTSGQGGTVSRYDVAAMTKKEREAIRLRAARGEQIRF